MFCLYLLVKDKVMIGIYKIRNIINDKFYIGSAKDIKRRWRRHKCGLRGNKHENLVLQRAWNKYGEENFVFEIVEICEMKELLELEQKYLDLKPQYNIGIVASGGDNITNNPNRDDIIKNIKNSLKLRVDNMNENERKMRFSMPKEKNPNWKGGKTYNYCKCGKKISPKSIHCNKCRPRSGKENPFFNKSHTDETKNTLSKKRKGVYIGSQNIKFTIDNIEYFSLGDASNKLKIPIPTVLWRLKSKNKKFENYKYI
jgi:group I intron endonuclease